MHMVETIRKVLLPIHRDNESVWQTAKDLHLQHAFKKQCIRWAKTHPHPEDRNRTIWQAFEYGKKHLIKLQPVFDDYAEPTTGVIDKYFGWL